MEFRKAVRRSVEETRFVKVSISNILEILQYLKQLHPEKIFCYTDDGCWAFEYKTDRGYVPITPGMIMTDTNGDIDFYTDSTFHDTYRITD